MADYQIKLMRRGVLRGHYINLMNIHISVELFHSIIWRALKVLKRYNPDFHYEVWSEGELICDGSNHIKVGDKKGGS